MEFGAGRVCLICGAKITNENPDGIGYSCRKLYPEAENIVIQSENKYFMRNIKMGIWMQEFSDFVSKRTGKNAFRSQFKKDFSESMLKQWNESQKISNKQFQIVYQILCGSELYKNGGSETEAKIDEKVSLAIKDFKRNYFAENPMKRKDVFTVMTSLWRENGAKKEDDEN